MAEKKSPKSKKLTPMMTQYQSIRRSLPDDVVLFFRLGDFYEMFFEDAKRAAGVLNLALTKRHDVPMCGFPYHSAEGYIAKLVRANTRVAIAEQTSTPVAGQLVEREVTQIISAGTVNDVNLLDDTRHNYLASVFLGGTKKNPRYAIACADHTTGEFTLAEFSNKELMKDELKRLSPSEIIISDDQIPELGDIAACQAYDAYAYLLETAQHTLETHFKVNSLDGFGCAKMETAISAAGAILHYLSHQLRRSCDHLRSLSVRESANYVLIDASSQVNLDLVESRTGKQHTLLGAMDKTSTPMGARKLRDWILHPLRDLTSLIARQDLIAAFLAQPYLLSTCRTTLKSIRDIERTTGRLSQRAGTPRDLQSLGNSLAHIPTLKEDLAAVASSTPLASQLLQQIEEFPELVSLLESALVDEPPASMKDGGVIRDGYHPELNELRAATKDGKKWIAELQETERKRTGIDTLKIKFNNVFGYFIEVTKARADKVPEDYTRKQTMANAERFITPELKEVENKVLGAEERSKQLELEEFTKLRTQICEYIDELQATADALATLDVLLGLAETAQLYGHTRPLLDESTHLQIIEGRHPVLEQTLENEKFVPNDTTLDPDNSNLLILTGPNMAGKSTYIRQVALITLMAQIGAYVPAESAHIGITDRIFCRVGASDDLARGQSTFMVEMNETSLIVNNATRHSLVILDEIGRGTATFDGLSIAWSVAEHLHDDIKARTLFATHYHELTDLANTRDAVANYNVAVREWNDDIIFLRKILPGTADKSYGIQVAKLAGLPPSIVNRAKDILSHLEMNSSKPDARNKPKAKNTRQTMPDTDSPQMDLF